MAGEREALNDSTSEVLQCLRSEATVKRLVAAVQLGVGLLQQGRPELRRVCRVEVDQAALVRWQAVVNQHLHPVAEVPESEPGDFFVNSIRQKAKLNILGKS